MYRLNIRVRKIKKLSHKSNLFLLVFLVIFVEVLPAEPVDLSAKQFTYSWQFLDSDTMKPRGGTTIGAPIELATLPRKKWKKLVESTSSKFDKDRLAILALAGNYRVTFDFIETIVTVPTTKPDKPYQSWGTEHIFVIDDQPKFISLQHVLVMTFLNADGSQSTPMVMKHWRQDWTYEDSDLHVFNLRKGWSRKDTGLNSSGKWSQAVYQVDDSPRYEALGVWEHTTSFSTWESEDTLRPLPRREFSVRSDYDSLWGTNRITITPSGWVQEEDNLKLLIVNTDKKESTQKFKAREAGIARYELLKNFDVSAARKYWLRTQYFWRDVRSAWQELKKKKDAFKIKKTVNEQTLVSVMFNYADELAKNSDYNRRQSTRFIDETFRQYCY